MSICGEGTIVVIEDGIAVVEVGPEHIEVDISDEDWPEEGMPVMLTIGARQGRSYEYYIRQEIKDYSSIYPKDQRYKYYNDGVEPLS